MNILRKLISAIKSLSTTATDPKDECEFKDFNQITVEDYRKDPNRYYWDDYNMEYRDRRKTYNDSI